MLTNRDEEMLYKIASIQRVINQAAAYTVYAELTPKNKKPISQRDFNKIFEDNINALKAYTL